MNTRRAPLPAQSNGSQPPSSDRVGARPRTSGDTGAAGHGLTRRTAVLAVVLEASVARGQDTVAGFHHAFWWATGFTVVGAVLATMLPNRAAVAAR